MSKNFTQNYKVKIADCDMLHRMTLGTCLRYVQQVANEHAWALGINSELHKKTNTGYIIAKAAAVCHKIPVFNQNIIVTTHVAATGRAQNPRYTEIKDASTGELLVEVCSIWVLIDTKLHKILRRAPEGFPDVFEKWDIPTLNLKIEKAIPTNSKIETATFLRCDENMHINNTSYADIVCDNLPLEIVKNKQWKRFAISYHNEIPVTAQFNLQSAKIQNDDFYFTANMENTNCFEAQISFEV